MPHVGRRVDRLVFEAALFENIVQRFRLEAIDQQERLVIGEVIERSHDVLEWFAVYFTGIQFSIRGTGPFRVHISVFVRITLYILPMTFASVGEYTPVDHELRCDLYR